MVKFYRDSYIFQFNLKFSRKLFANRNTSCGPHFDESTITKLLLNTLIFKLLFFPKMEPPILTMSFILHTFFDKHNLHNVSYP